MNARLDLGLATAQAILADAERLAYAPADRSARPLRFLSDRLVCDLVPLLAAAEEVLQKSLDEESYVSLNGDHRAVRALTERLESLADAADGRGDRSQVREPVQRALRETVATLASLVVHQRATVCRLREVLSFPDLERLGEAFQAAEAAARERTMLIVSPPVPATASTVLRKRPDLDAASAWSLAAIERSRHTGGHI